jgi:iron complex transport system substrate-binding protein
MLCTSFDFGQAAAADVRRTLTDQLGRTVAVPASPQRMVALAPSITEVVFALGQGHRLAGATAFSNFPAAARNLPKVGSYVHLDLEKILALQPDLCLAIKDGNPKTVIERLEALGIPVYAVDIKNMTTLMDALRLLGGLLSAETAAQALTKRLGERIEGVQAVVSQARTRPRVFFQIGIAPIVSAGSETFIHELIETAGGINTAAGPTAYPRFSREQVLALAPDVFIISSMARGRVFDKIKAEWSHWSQMPAAANDRIHLVDSDVYDRPTPRLVDAMEELAGLIHPELFGSQP